jgi:hypothetical protein
VDGDSQRGCDLLVKEERKEKAVVRVKPPEYQYLTLSVFLLTEAGRRLGLEDGSVTVFV